MIENSLISSTLVRLRCQIESMSLEKRRQQRGRPGDTRDLAIDLAVLEDEKEEFARAAASLVRDILDNHDSSFGRELIDSLGSQATPYQWMIRSGVHQVTLASWLK